HLYVRLDPAKVNLIPKLDRAEWYQLVGVPLDNGNELYPNGDTIQVAVPWKPPALWVGITPDITNAILDDIDRGLPDADGQPTGRRYSEAAAAKDRSVIPVLRKHLPQKTDGQCRQIVVAWIKNQLLYSEVYHDPTDRKADRKGLFVNDEKRPKA